MARTYRQAGCADGRVMPDKRREAEPGNPEAEAAITETDKAEDRVFWEEHGSALTKAMLNAKPEKTHDGRNHLHG